VGTGACHQKSDFSERGINEFRCSVDLSAPDDQYIEGAVPLLQCAIEIDLKFAAAYNSLGQIYADMWEPELAAESIRKAYELRERASDPERFSIMLNYHEHVTGNLEEAQRTPSYGRRCIPGTWAALMDRGWFTSLWVTFENPSRSADGRSRSIPIFLPPVSI
jgi:hypothetical protein